MDCVPSVFSATDQGRGVERTIYVPLAANLGAQNVTVKDAPRPFPPSAICNSPPICFTSEPIIFIPRPLLLAGSNPAGNPGPSSDTDSE